MLVQTVSNAAPHSPQNFMPLFSRDLFHPQLAHVTSVGMALPQPPQNFVVLDVPHAHVQVFLSGFAGFA